MMQNAEQNAAFREFRRDLLPNKQAQSTDFQNKNNARKRLFSSKKQAFGLRKFASKTQNRKVKWCKMQLSNSKSM